MKTEKCEQWVARDNAVMAPFGRVCYYPLVLKSASGSIITDADGNQFIDLLSSAGSLNLGHAHPRIVQAVEEQARQYTQYTNAYFYNPKAIELAEALVKIAPGGFPKRVAYGLTGSDSIDGAIKVARAYTGRTKIISFIGAYHGSTYGALSVSNISLNMRRKLGAMLPDAYAFPFPNTYRDGADAGERCLDSLRKAFATYLPPEEVAAVLVEPIQGDGGILIPPEGFFSRLSDLCNEHGILLVSDEVQQGFMRTGTWFGMEHFGVTPDITVMGKSMAGGMPLSAIVGRAQVMESLDPPAHVFTFAGCATSCASALACIEVMSESGFRQGVIERSAYLRSKLEALQDKHPFIGQVRGLGFSLGVELVESRESKRPAQQAAAKICYQAWRNGVLLVCFAGNVLRIQPPLIITAEEIDRAVAVIDQAMADFARGAIPDSVLDMVHGW